jgi:hypothetical protein
MVADTEPVLVQRIDGVSNLLQTIILYAGSCNFINILIYIYIVT